MTIGLLPDFYASRMPGLLVEIEGVAAIAEAAPSVAAAADDARPADDPQAITLTSAIRWVRRRVRAVHRLLATVIGLVPERFEGCVPRVASFRERLGITNVLVALREICAGSLHALAAPLGLLAPPKWRVLAIERHQQSSGPGPPPATS